MRINDFSRGWRPHIAPDALPMDSGAGTLCQNLLLDRGTLRPRPPRYTHDTLASGAWTGVRSLFPYAHHHTSPSSRLLAALTNGTLIASDTDTQTFDTAITLDTRLSSVNRLRVTQHGKHLYLVDGEGAVHRWAGGTDISAIAQDAGHGPGPSIEEGSRFTGSFTTIYTITISVAGARDDVDGVTTGQFTWSTDRGGSGAAEISETTALSNGVTLRWERASYQLGDVWKFRCLAPNILEPLEDSEAPPIPPDITTSPNLQIANCKLGALLGSGERPSAGDTDGKWKAGFLAPVTDFSGDDTADFASVADVDGPYVDLCVRRFTETANYRTGSDAVGMEILFTSTVEGYAQRDQPVWCWMRQGFLDPVDISLDDTLQITFKLVTLQGRLDPTTRLFVELDSQPVDGHLRILKEIDLDPDTTPLNTWVTKEVSLSDVPADQRAAITQVALAFYTGERLYSTERLEGHDGMYGTTAVGPGAVTFTLAVTLIVDQLVAVSTAPWFPSEEYQFLYTYGRYDGVRWVESPHSLIVTKVAPKERVSVWSITGKADAAAHLTAGDHLYVYALGGPLTTWRRIGDVKYKTGEDTYTVRWHGEIDKYLDGYEPYVKAPPRGASLVLTYRDRVGYVKDDWLYLSNQGDPTRVPDRATERLYDNYGGKVRIGAGGGDVLAVGSARHLACFFKREGIWTLTGDNAREFVLTQVSADHGCESPETVATLADSRIIWLDTSGDVCTLDEGGIHRLGADERGRCPVGDTLRAATVTQRTAARAYVDHAGQRYVLTLPPAVTGTPYQGTAYVYDFVADAWSVWTAQPVGGACELLSGSRPGVYAGDEYALIVSLVGATTQPTGLAAGESVAVAWRSMMLDTPPGMFHAIERYIATVNGTEDLTLTIYRNGEESASYTHLFADAVAYRRVAWQPASPSDWGAVQIGLAWTENGWPETEILALDLRTTERGGFYE